MAVTIINRDGFFSWPTNGSVHLYTSLTSNSPKKGTTKCTTPAAVVLHLSNLRRITSQVIPRVQRFCNEGLLLFAYFPCRFFTFFSNSPFQMVHILYTTGEPHTVLQSKIHLDITIQNNYRYGWIFPTRLGTVHFLWGRGDWWDLEECNLKMVWPPPQFPIFSHPPPPHQSNFLEGPPPPWIKKYIRY